jgi:hypothetical protein
LALSALSIDPLVCIWYFGDYYKYPNPHFSADAHDMSILSHINFIILKNRISQTFFKEAKSNNQILESFNQTKET